MEEKRNYYCVKDENSLGIVRSTRDTPPAHFLYKIESFGSMSDFSFKCGAERLRTPPFVSCGFKWALSLFPRGDKKRDGDGHISLYLVLVDAASFPTGLQLHAIFKLFLYDHIRKKYLIVERDVSGASLFNKLRTRDGFSRFIPLATFHDSSSGFKEGESCVFGAEVYVIENEQIVAKDACLTNLAPSKTFFSHAVEFSKIPSDNYYYSPSFWAGETKWFISLRKYTSPGGSGHIGFRLTFADPVNFPPSILTRWRKRRNNRGLEEAVFAKGTMSIEDQLHGKHAYRNFGQIFRSSSNCWSYGNFLSMDHLKDPSKGYMVNGRMNVKVEFSLVVGCM